MHLCGVYRFVCALLRAVSVLVTALLLAEMQYTHIVDMLPLETIIHVSSYYYILLYMFPHIAMCILTLLYMCAQAGASTTLSQYYYVCVLILLHVSSYYYTCVLILLYICPHTTI